MIQAEGANMSASASAEANAVKISGNSLEVNFGGGKSGFPNNVLRAINPVWYEEREAKAREIRAKSLERTIDTLMEGCPVMTRKRAIMEAMGYSMTNEQADNFAAVSNRASAILEEAGGAVNPILPEMRDCIVDGASHAYEDDVRELWGKILAGEVNKPGSFSKRTLSILSDMGKAEAEAFMKLCSFSTRILTSNGATTTLKDFPIPVLAVDEEGSSYNNGEIGAYELSTLDSLGLIDKSLFGSEIINKGEDISFLANNTLIVAHSPRSNVQVTFMSSFCPPGVELSRICNLGCAPELTDILASQLARKGLEVMIEPSPTDQIRMHQPA